VLLRRQLFGLVLILQGILGARVALRLIRTASGRTIRARSAPVEGSDGCTVIVPVLNEVRRLGPCLTGLSNAGVVAREILIVDGGSTDGTQELVAGWEQRDARIKLIDASPIPDDWNGKAWGLHCGLGQGEPSNPWVLTIDADVRPASDLIPALIAHARAEGVGALSAATAQTLSGPAEGVVHPAMLATLVYRFGIPGHAAVRVADVQANGQCFLVRRDVLERSGGFAAVRGSVCEDVTLARRLVAAGERVGFYETDALVSVAMYAGWRDAWRNWTRSLPLRDRYWGRFGPLGLVEVAVVQALPLPLALILRWRSRRNANGGVIRAGWALNAMLAAMRLGVLSGMARAYERRLWTYWLSPLADVPVAVALVVSASRRIHRWRGRTIERS
jgi:dolichol-phosphate mannosyltransferase